MDETPITRQMVKEILLDWEMGNVSSQELCIWAEVNYLPLHRDIAPEETSTIQRAIHIVLNALDHINPEQINPNVIKAALNFLDSTEEGFDNNADNFLESL